CARSAALSMFGSSPIGTCCDVDGGGGSAGGRDFGCDEQPASPAARQSPSSREPRGGVVTIFSLSSTKLASNRRRKGLRRLLEKRSLKWKVKTEKLKAGGKSHFSVLAFQF